MQMRKMAQRGFTLIELMIVVAIIGILAAVAIPMFWEAATKAKKSEAYVQLEKLKKGVIAEYTTSSAFPKDPAAITPVTDCCTQSVGKKNRKCDADPNDWNTDAWRALEFSLNESFYFQYAYTPSGTGASATFAATAVGDTDCDGTSITFKLSGTMVGGAPKIVLTEPTNDD